MNLHTLKLVRAEIAAAPAAAIDMSEWALKDDDLILLRDIDPTTNPAIDPGCGTCGCLAGWTVFTAFKHGIAGRPTDAIYTYADAAAQHLDIDTETAYELFIDEATYGRDTLKDVTRADVLKKLDELIAEEEAKA